ncbi:DUF7553 family protein [Salarchaeum japonicum]|uniref:Uncharacterized protein n=1 Tax=Salarchaeum japonicum TaxID=555573 RepID=A0AAV3SX34_9EURY|nr:hypothetical protein [Salarchaeum japonicum]
MNERFQDARHHVERAVTNAREGLEDEFEDIENRVRELVGKETEPEPSRVENLKRDLKGLEQRAEGDARAALKKARDRLDNTRSE